MDRDEVEVHKHAKKERGQYPAILTKQAWSIKDLLYDFFRALKKKSQLHAQSMAHAKSFHWFKSLMSDCQILE